MIVRSIRLLNIKSYGEGPEGKGVTVQFEPGINRIAGKNGHGKSTLIESLGYALFLTDPIYEEGFDIATYLLRSGKKAGEIDVVFEIKGQTYRLERGLGSQNKRRSKVILVNDGSTEAEGDKQVAEYLCRQLGCPDQARFSELFAKLVGVKQGRLTWPFDSKPAEARKYFEPLLDVEIFRQCFDQLKPVVDRFESLQTEREKELAAVEERIKERADSPVQLNARQEDVNLRTNAVEARRQEKQAVDQNRRAQEKREQAYREAKTALDGSLNARSLAAQKKEEDQRQVQESLDAVAAASATLSNFEAYGKAEGALRGLQDQQAQKSRLEKNRAETANLKTECEGKARAARQQAENYGKQKETKTEAVKKLKMQIADDQNGLLDTNAQFQKSEATTTNARQSRDACDNWLNATKDQIDSNADLLAEILEDWTKIESWKPASLSEAREREDELDKAAKSLAKKLAEAEKLKETLAGQLEEIGGGICPFLKEKCRQFDPKKIRSDVSARQEEIKQLTKKQSEATAAHQQARALVEKLANEEARLAQTRKLIERKVGSFVKAHNKLFSAAAQQHFGVLADYLPKQAARLTIQPLAEATAGECFDISGKVLNPRVIRGVASAETQFHAQVSGILTSIAKDLENEIKSFEKQRDGRLGKERDLKNKQGNLEEIEAEIKVLTANIKGQSDVGRKSAEDAAAAGKRVTDFDEKLKLFQDVERQLEQQRNLKDQNADGHAKYLGAKPSADRLKQRQQALKKSTETEAQVSEQVRQRQTTFDEVRREFDPAALELARKKSEEATQQLATESAHLENAKRDLVREQARFAEWQAATREREAVQVACGKLHACIELTQKARHILQKAAPMVAQHVCQRIAGRAQQIFNQINTDPVELEWNSERYSLRIAPGERRFAMLSGGEQTKLALAMTLSMIQEFCGLKFCIFDEPTYAVDADSRHKLADAIVRLQGVNESKLDQILLVSHDDAFEGKIENVVMIRKTANGGSAPLLTT